jgi:hypothetical protein
MICRGLPLTPLNVVV